jgi:hypothetical protein
MQLLIYEAKTRKWTIRGIVLLNFGMLCALASPWNAYGKDSIKPTIPYCTHRAGSWLAGSTLFATVFFFYPLILKSNPEINYASETVRLDGWFLLVWWIAVVLLVLYGLVLGAGG